MILELKDFLKKHYNIDGNIVLYRDDDHRKKKMCEYVVRKMNIQPGQEVATYSDGAFALYLARALPQNTVHAYYVVISPDYGEVMEQQTNLVLHPHTMHSNGDYKNIVESQGYINVFQYDSEIVKQYYASHFPTIVTTTKDLNIDAFVECTHSGATLGGFLDANAQHNLVDWQFIVASLHDNINKITGNKYLKPYKDQLTMSTVHTFDTYDLGCLIEQTYPNFGNIYEATRSISGAMNWLLNNPGKTVLVYVGDSYQKEGTKFR